MRPTFISFCRHLLSIAAQPAPILSYRRTEITVQSLSEKCAMIEMEQKVKSMILCIGINLILVYNARVILHSNPI